MSLRSAVATFSLLKTFDWLYSVGPLTLTSLTGSHVILTWTVGLWSPEGTRLILVVTHRMTITKLCIPVGARSSLTLRGSIIYPRGAMNILPYGQRPGPGITNVLTHLILCVRKKMAIVCNH